MQLQQVNQQSRVDTDIDWEAFDRDGVLLIPNFFDQWEATQMEADWDRLAQMGAQAGLKRSDRYMFGVLPGMIGGIYRHPKLIALARAFCGDDVCLYLNRILLKDAGWNGPVAMHQDMPYNIGGHRKFSLFVPLKPVQADGGNGGLKYVLGSHRYGNLGPGVIDRRQFPPMPDFAPDMSVGDILLMSYFTWHWSEAAPVPAPRPLLQITYQPADDGSFSGIAWGVPEPTLVRGEWRTKYFAELHRGIIPNK